MTEAPLDPNSYAGRRPTPDMENVRQKLISLFFVLLMVGSGLAYAVTLF